MEVFVGHDWAEVHHDVCVIDGSGEKLGYGRVGTGIEGLADFHALVGAHIDDPAQVTIATETDSGLFVSALVAAGYRVHAVNPMSVKRYRERFVTSGAKSDAGDAWVLAELARSDARHHRQIAGDSVLAEAVKVLARSHQNLIWTRQRQTNQLRSALSDFYPAALEAFGDLAHNDAIAVLQVAPTPQLGRRLSLSEISSALRRGGRQRNIDKRAAEILQALRSEHLQAAPLIEKAMGANAAALINVIATLVDQTALLETELASSFETHPDAKIIQSLPGLGMILGARVLAEFGDDPERYADAKSRKNYAGTSPITKASGTKHVVLARNVRNKRLAAATFQWAFAAITASPGARTFYDQRKAKGDTHSRALRALANKLVGILHGCLKHQTPYNENTAWAHRQPQAA